MEDKKLFLLAISEDVLQLRHNSDVESPNSQPLSG